MNAVENIRAANQDSGIFFSDVPVFSRVRERSQRSSREFAAWMVGLRFAGDALAVVGGLLLAFAVCFLTPLRSLGHRAAMGMNIEQYSGHFFFLGVTLLLCLFHFGLYGSGRPQRIREVNAILLISGGVWLVGNLGLSFPLMAQPIISRIHLSCAFACTLTTLVAWRWLPERFYHLPAVAGLFQRRILFVVKVFLSGLHLETTSGVPAPGISRLPLDSPWNQILKRCFDLAGALVGLVLSSPLIAVFGTLVYLESPGPVFYRQTRLGRGGRKFSITKIRSMRLDAEAAGAIGWSRKSDDRRLRVGSLIRALNIDELPQFWNVLKGEMSLVGPRPERPEFTAAFEESIPHYTARHGIKPGITGWAQVNGFQGDTDLNERVECDLFYIENWNILLELQILLMTLCKRSNAY